MNQETPFNQLTPAEVERLALLAEECAEVIQIVGKILRHGYNYTHPDNKDGPDNRRMLETGLGHIEGAVNLLIESRDLAKRYISYDNRLKLCRIRKYLHHQTEA